MGVAGGGGHLTTIDGIVVHASKGLYLVQTDHGRMTCRLRGNLKKQFEFSTSDSRARKVVQARKKTTTDPLAVGDRVEVEPHRGAEPGTGRDEGGGDAHEGVIVTLQPRRNEVARERRVIGAEIGVGRHVLVANLEQLIIVFAVAEPRLDAWKLDRLLVVAEASGLEPVIVANKVDLSDPDSVEADVANFERIGYRVLRTSAKTGDGLEDLRGLLWGRISSLCGPSGVGKSSLLNAMYPGLDRHVAEFGQVTWKGRHGTTAAELIALDPAADWRETGWVADTPGLRQVELWQIPAAVIADCFPEFRPHLANCKFNDCQHRGEPGCAVHAAVDAGLVDARRYRSYVILAEESRRG